VLPDDVLKRELSRNPRAQAGGSDDEQGSQGIRSLLGCTDNEGATV
jgi:hypothetical protein